MMSRWMTKLNTEEMLPMTRHDEHLEAGLRLVLQREASEVWPPSTLWPRVQAHLSRPVEGVPALVQTPAGLQMLVRRGDLRRLMLALLAEQAMDAFTLARRVEYVARSACCTPPSEGNVLPVLHRLEIDGLLSARWRSGPSGLRRSYSLSARGRRIRRRMAVAWWLARAGTRVARLIPGWPPSTRLRERT